MICGCSVSLHSNIPLEPPPPFRTPSLMLKRLVLEETVNTVLYMHRRTPSQVQLYYPFPCAPASTWPNAASDAAHVGDIFRLLLFLRRKTFSLLWLHVNINGLAIRVVNLPPQHIRDDFPEAG